MSFVNAVKTCLRKYFVFSGRASRPEFWKFILFLLIGSIVMLTANGLIFGPEVTYVYPTDPDGNLTGQPNVSYTYNGGIPGNIFVVLTLIPSLAVSWRRMHDINLPGYMIVLPWLIFVIAVMVSILSTVGIGPTVDALRATGHIRVVNPTGGLLVLLIGLGALVISLVWLTRRSDPIQNRFGPNPQEVI